MYPKNGGKLRKMLSIRTKTFDHLKISPKTLQDFLRFCSFITNTRLLQQLSSTTNQSLNLQRRVGSIFRFSKYSYLLILTSLKLLCVLPIRNTLNTNSVKFR